MSEVPEGWRIATINEVAEVNPRLGKADIPNDLPVTFVPMSCVGAGNGTVDISHERPYSEVKKGFTPFTEGDVLFAKITPCMENGKVAVVPKLRNGHGFGSTEFHVLRPRTGIDARYLYYFISNKSFRAEAEHHMTGGVGQKRVPTAYIKACTIPVAPLKQQHRIVAEIEKNFSRLDEGVANLKRIKANLKRYKTAVLKAAVEGKLTEQWRKDHPNVEPADKLLDRIFSERRQKWNGKGPYREPGTPVIPNLQKLPNGWVWTRLDTIANLQGGITVDKNRSWATARSVPYLRVANVQRGFLDLSKMKNILAPEKEIEDLRLVPGDILFTEGGDRDKLGRGWIWEGQLSECIHQNHVFRARLYSNNVSSKFVSWWGNSFGQHYFLREGKQTTNLASINITKLSALPIPIPPREEQRMIGEEVERRLSVIAELDGTVEANLKRADRLRQSLLQQAFTGHIPYCK